MKILSLVFTVFILLAQLCQGYPVSLAILQHPTTKACVALIGDVHYVMGGNGEDNKNEAAFEAFWPELEHYIRSHDYTFLLECNVYDEEQAQKHSNLHKNALLKGLQAFSLHYALHKKSLPHYKPCDPRTKNSKIFIRLYYYFDKIMHDLYTDIITHLTQAYNSTHDYSYKQQIQEWLNDIILYEEYPASCFPYFLHEKKNTPITYQFLLTSLTKHICTYLCAEPQDLTTVTPYNLFLDLELLASSLYNGLLYLQLHTPYKECAHTIKKAHENFMHRARTFKMHWNSVQKLPLPQALLSLVIQNEDNDLGVLCGKIDEQTSDFYEKLCLTNADTSMSLAILNHKKSVLYAGAAHCQEVQKLLNTGGFTCVFYQSNNYQPINDFHNFYTTLKNLQ